MPIRPVSAISATGIDPNDSSRSWKLRGENVKLNVHDSGGALKVPLHACDPLRVCEVAFNVIEPAWLDPQAGKDPHGWTVVSFDAWQHQRVDPLLRGRGTAYRTAQRQHPATGPCAGRATP